MESLARWSVAALMVFLLGGCSSAWNATKKTAQVIWDPSIPVGDMTDRETLLTFSMYAQTTVNPNAEGEPTPIEMVVFELEDDSKFLAADFDSLIADFKKSLGSNYVDHSDFTLLPGQFKFVDPMKVDGDVRYIGVIAKFSQPEQAQWKKVIKIKSVGHEYHLLMFFDDHSIILDKVE
ncbi:type VI secretion system lipoprotein TssJ [Shewanella khirikhana]|uniref:Type VI secretion lipoprotein n=1 Tax=Shewanella khirikhana TaxID=1965282 RepID=A0ABN5TVQ2_9GAMM|nr:type VI secretion system lipoprotein TssJ [Shewanella khirikhana]AZQ11519.1 Type VI secretion lipoprotein [Shewanella khirikhana]